MEAVTHLWKKNEDARFAFNLYPNIMLHIHNLSDYVIQLSKPFRCDINHMSIRANLMP